MFFLVSLDFIKIKNNSGKLPTDIGYGLKAKLTFGWSNYIDDFYKEEMSSETRDVLKHFDQFQTGGKPTGRFWGWERNRTFTLVSDWWLHSSD